MYGMRSICVRDWKCSADCGLSVHSDLLVLMCAKCYWLVRNTFSHMVQGL
jgi:hypothetical protein